MGCHSSGTNQDHVAKRDQTLWDVIVQEPIKTLLVMAAKQYYIIHCVCVCVCSGLKWSYPQCICAWASLCVSSFPTRSYTPCDILLTCVCVCVCVCRTQM